MQERDELICSLIKEGHSKNSLGKRFNLSHQRIVQIYAKKHPSNYSSKTLSSHIKKDINEVKIWTKEKRKYLGLPSNYNPIKSGGLDFIRELVRMRDNRTCQKCFKVWKEGERRFDVHHQDQEMEGRSGERGMIQLDKQNMSKMITYCHKCHFAEHSVRERIKKGRR